MGRRAAEVVLILIIYYRLMGIELEHPNSTTTTAVKTVQLSSGNANQHRTVNQIERKQDKCMY